MFKLLLPLTLLSAFVWFPATPPAMAQGFDVNNDNNFGLGGDDEEESEDEGITIINPYDEQYRPNPNIGKKGLNRPPSPIPQGSYTLKISNIVTGREGDFSINIQPTGSVSGCLTSKKPIISKKITGKKLKVTVTENVITADTYKTRYSQHECEVTMAGSLASVILNRDDMIRNNIEEITIEEENLGAIGTYEVDFAPHSAVFKMRYPVYSEPYLAEETDRRTVWFFPVGSMALFNQSLDLQDPDTYAKFLSLARSKGLTPIEDINPAYARLQDLHIDNLIVVDVENRYGGEFESLNNAFTLGNIDINQLYVGPEGEYARPVTKPVFARLAGVGN